MKKANYFQLAKIFTVSVLAVVCTSANAQTAPDLYYNDLDATTKSEAATFVQMYVQMLETGVPAIGADSFAYTNPDANTPLFSPYIGYMRTLAKIHANGQVYFGDKINNTKISNYATSDVISTPLSDPLATTNNMIAVLESQNTGAVAAVVDSSLVSTGVQTTLANSVGAFFVSPSPPPSPKTWMDELPGFASSIASSFDPSTDIQHLLLGQPTNADFMSDQIFGWLLLAFPSEFDEDVEFFTYVVHAVFGKYGALPIVVITFDGGYFLVNGMNGETAGPFHKDDDINPEQLLSNTSQYATGSSFGTINSSNSTNLVKAPRPRAAPPTGYVPDPSCTPAGCWQPRRWYTCSLTVRGKCRCTAQGRMTAIPPATGSIPTTMTCIGPPMTGNNPCRSNIAPPGAIPGLTCTQTYVY